ncbi:MAG: hypothetical protein AAGJ73_13265 [Pseudomonadota bacterium]
MTFVGGVTLPGLGTGAGFALWTFRAMASGCNGCNVLRRGFDRAFGEGGPRAFDEMRQFTRLLGNAGTRRILLAGSGCCRVTADELSMVAVLAAAQDHDYDRCKAHLCWLMGGREDSAAITAASRVASVFQVAGLQIIAPSIELSMETKPLRGTVLSEVGHA